MQHNLEIKSIRTTLIVGSIYKLPSLSTNPRSTSTNSWLKVLKYLTCVNLINKGKRLNGIFFNLLKYVIRVNEYNKSLHTLTTLTFKGLKKEFTKDELSKSVKYKLHDPKFQ